MLFWKCKYYKTCGSVANCAACSAKKQLIKEDLLKQFPEIFNQKGGYKCLVKENS